MSSVRATRPLRTTRRRGRLIRRLTGVGAVSGLLLSLLLPASASSAGTSGTFVLGGLTAPAGGVWLPGAGTSSGHFWSPDALLGLCRVDQTPAGFTRTNCETAVSVTGQVVYDAVHRLVYVADANSTSNDVVRFAYDQNTETLTAPVRITVPPGATTTTGGGKTTAAGRAMSLGLTPDGTTLFVGYAKSGDISALTSVFGAASATGATLPTSTSTAKIGVTSDGRGSNGGLALLTHVAAGVLHTDLYVGETGGKGLSVIQDVTGTSDGAASRPACGSPGTCIAVTVKTSSGAVVSNRVGGLTSDGTVLYVGDAPVGLPGKVIQFNPTTGVGTDWSTSVPAYTAAFDGVRRTTYTGITGLGTGPGGMVLVGDDPTVGLVPPVTQQAHLWQIAPPSASAPTVTALSPASGATAGGTVVTVSGTNLLVNGGLPSVAFGSARATAVSCADSQTCTVTTPASAGAGTVDVVLTTSSGQVNSNPGRYTYVVAPPINPTSATPVVTAVSPARGLLAGGTVVTITGSNLAPTGGTTSVSFGPDAATTVSCNAAGTSCTATTPAAANPGVVDTQVTTSTGGTSATGGADQFEFLGQPVADLWAYGITAPKGGMVWVPNGRTQADGSKDGQWWSTDHAQGLCRMDPVPGAPLHALNTAVCDPGFALGSPGQAVWEPRANPDGTHWLYVPDNAVRSPGVSRIAVAVNSDGVETLKGSPEVLAPGAANTMANLKPNGMALGPDGDLYVGDLVDGIIRRIVNPAGDVRNQRVDDVGITQTQRAGAAARGINGTMAFVGSRLFLPENRGASYLDINADGSGTWDASATPVGACEPFILDSCPSSQLVNVQAVPAPLFIAAIGVDPIHHRVYISSSPGGAPATIFRFDPTTITADRPGGSPGVSYVSSGRVPATTLADGSANPAATVWCSLTCTRPADPTLSPGGTAGFSFAQGLMVDPSDGTLYIAQDVTAGARSGRGHIWSVPYLP